MFNFSLVLLMTLCRSSTRSESLSQQNLSASLKVATSVDVASRCPIAEPSTFNPVVSAPITEPGISNPVVTSNGPGVRLLQADGGITHAAALSPPSTCNFKSPGHPVPPLDPLIPASLRQSKEKSRQASKECEYGGGGRTSGNSGRGYEFGEDKRASAMPALNLSFNFAASPRKGEWLMVLLRLISFL